MSDARTPHATQPSENVSDDAGLAARVVREYAAFRTNALLVDRGNRLRTTFDGAKAGEVLAGLVTNDVDALTSEHGLYAAALTPKGKIVADVRIFARGSDFLVDLAAAAGAGWWALLRKYVNPRLARWTDVSGGLHDLGVFGPRAGEVAARVTGLAAHELLSLDDYAHRSVTTAGQPAMLARTPEAGLLGFEWFVAGEHVGAVRQALLAAGAVEGSETTWRAIRIEAGRPEYGIDMDDTTLPQEANFDELHAISYTKGCYTGQETVARVHFRGHVNRHLRGLQFADGPVPSRSELFHPPERSIGDVRSVAWSPRLGDIGVGMVRHEVEPGTSVAVLWDGGVGRRHARATVFALPFPLD